MPEKRLQTFRACSPVRNKGSKVAELTCGVGRSRSLSCLPAVNSADFPSSLFPRRLEVDAATDERVFVIWDGGGDQTREGTAGMRSKTEHKWGER